MQKIWQYILSTASGILIMAGPVLNYLSKKIHGNVKESSL